MYVQVDRRFVRTAFHLASGAALREAFVSTISLPHSPSQGSATLAVPRGRIACMICLAAYTPSRGYQHLLQAPTVVVESAFMSMCHFCFRCRRPACPMCWDEVNGICGVCVQETQLSFRAEPQMLAGVLVPPQPRQKVQAVCEQKGALPFVCVQAGRFQQVGIALAPISASLATPAAEPGQQERAPALVTQVSQQRVTDDIWDMTAWSSRQENGQDTLQEDEQGSQPTSLLVRAVQLVERVLTMLVLFILIGIVLLVVVSLVSLPANTLIANTLNIDIRAEIAYLLQLIQQLHL